MTATRPLRKDQIVPMPNTHDAKPAACRRRMLASSVSGAHFVGAGQAHGVVVHHGSGSDGDGEPAHAIPAGIESVQVASKYAASAQRAAARRRSLPHGISRSAAAVGSWLRFRRSGRPLPTRQSVEVPRRRGLGSCALSASSKPRARCRRQASPTMTTARRAAEPRARGRRGGVGWGTRWFRPGIDGGHRVEFSSLNGRFGDHTAAISAGIRW